MENRYSVKMPDDLKECKDDYYRLLSDGTFELGEDNVPDILEIDGYGVLFDGPSLDPTKLTVNQKYIECTTYYPAEYSCNTFPNKNYMFQIVGGSPVTDSFGYDISLPYTKRHVTDSRYLSTEDILLREFRFVQVIEFEAEMHHAFKSSTYPLDKAQLNIVICPNIWTVEYFRYIPTDRFEYDIAADIGAITYSVVTPTIASYRSGKNQKFYCTGGYNLINDSEYLSPEYDLINYKYGFMQQDILYERDLNGLMSPFSAMKLTMRIERTGMNAFLKAYLNLFAVVIWIIIGFFSEAYQGESSLGMLGTGLFAAISSIIVGLNMVSDAGFFSLLTMINIFTLFVILLMAYQSIMAKNAKVKGDAAAIAYYGIKLRILFFILSISTLILFVGLPIIAAV